MKKLLVPTDFSPNADKALDFAVQLAKKAKAKIILVHACDLLELTFKDNIALKKEYNRNRIKDLNAKLSVYRDSIKKSENVAIQTKLYEGLVTDTIIYAAETHRPDLIVMGTLGSASAKDKIFGSKTAALIGKTRVPVLAVPLLSEWAVPGKMLLAINSFLEGRKEVVLPVLELASLFNASIDIVKFSANRSVSAAGYLTIQRSGTNYIKKIQGIAPAVNCKFVHLEGHKFEKTIEKYISKNNIDMLIMITHKRSFAKSIFKRSVTKKMAYQSSIPLLALPA